ncbi:MAG: CDGSH iron-sulfur domain-containing protein [Bacteroidetes bacterium]|nr:CDGSH iron-sulfur domain-containing protein [Bacteroidota bacterium]MCH8524255.1 CDGSH iron-sulfur domain-containing protein [Balneolales bacterium]
MQTPEIGGRKPIKVEEEIGAEYYWCSCGKSKNQPFCDGSHAGSGFEPMKIVPEKEGRAFLCTCKQTANPPYCDGAHKHLPTE